MQPAQSAMLSGPSRLLLTLSFGSRVVRLTDGERVDVARSRATDPALAYMPGLSVSGSVDRLLVFASSGVNERSVSVDAQLPFDPSAEMERGRWPTTCELAQLYPGQTWEERRVLIEGLATSVQVGSNGGSISLAVRESPGDDTGQMLNEGSVVSANTFPRTDAGRGTAYVGANERINEDILGAYLPVVIGEPGNGATVEIAGNVNDSPVNAWPGLYVEITDSNVTTTDHVIAVAQHPMAASTVNVVNITEGKSWTGTVQTGIDKLGQAFSFVNPPSNSDIPTQDATELWCRAIAGSGGILDPFGVGALRRVDHVIRWALSKTTIRIDQRQIGRLEALRGYKIDGYINEPVGAWEWLSREILPLLPVSVVYGPGGLYIAPFDPDAPASMAVAHIEHGRNADRITPRTYTGSDEIVNEAAIEFGLNARTGVYAQRRKVGGRLTEADSLSDYVTSDLWAQRSQSHYGRLPQETIQTAYIYDSSTALAVLSWQIRHRSLPRMRVGYQLVRSLDYLRPGDLVTVTDSAQSWSSRVMHVEGVSLAGGAPSVALTAWSPARYTG